MREVHHVGGAEDQHDAERDQRIDGADADAGKEQLKDEIHGTRSVRGSQHLDKNTSASPAGTGEAEWRRSVVELDVLVEDDVALVVLHDVVAVKPVAVLVEIVFALGAREFLGREDRLADLGGSVEPALLIAAASTVTAS